jgi:hypothetical protein
VQPLYPLVPEARIAVDGVRRGRDQRGEIGAIRGQLVAELPRALQPRLERGDHLRVARPELIGFRNQPFEARDPRQADAPRRSASRARRSLICAS